MINIYSSAILNRKRIFSLLLFFSAISLNSYGQVSLYGFSQSTGTYTPITGGTTLATGPGWDDDTWGSVPIGFTFTYNSTAYTEVSVAANGYVAFGSTIPGCCFYNGTSIQNLDEAVHIFSEDLYGNNAGSELRYETSGTPGSQVFTLQWKDWGFWTTGNAEINFQLKLHEGSNVIEFAYSPGTIGTAFQTTQVGLTGTPVSDFNSRTTTTDWTATTASTVNTDQMNFNSGVFPPTGLSYFWTLAPIDMSPTALVTPVASQCYTTTETVTIRIRNSGSNLIDFSVNPVTVSSSVAGPNPQTFAPVVISTGTLATNTTLDVVITTTYDMSAAGTYTFSASTSISGDGNPANDNMPPAVIDGTIASGTAALTADTICSGASSTLTLTTYNGTIQWQSFNGVSWVNETGPGNNTASYSVSPLVNTDFRAVVCGSAISNVVTLTVITVVPPTTTGDTRCGYGVVNLSASGVGTLNWYTTVTGGVPVNSGPTYSPTVSATTTYYVESAVGASNFSPLTTTFAAGNGFLGNMFDIHAINSITITHFDGHMDSGTADWEVWYRPGTFVGNTNDSTQWIHLGTAYGVVAAGLGNPTPIPITFAVPIPAGSTYGFYVTARSNQVNYTNGTAVGNVFASDPNLEVLEGNGGDYFNVTFSPRVFNGKVYYETGCASARTAVTATVTFADSITITASQTSICGLPASVTVTLNASSLNSSYNYSWTGADLNSTTGPSVTATPNATTIYTVVGDDGVCANSASITIILTAPPPAVATANPSSVCLGLTSQFSTPPGQVTYTVSSIAYAPMACTGTQVTLFDDELSPALPIGFTFNFYGVDQTQFHISSNGFLSFDPNAGSGCCTGQLLPNAFGPNDVIALAWEDFYPPFGGTISYYTTGTAPTRKLVVCYSGIGHFFDGNNPMDGQIILYEGTNCIEMHITSFSTDGDGQGETQGVENASGTVASFVPGRNSATVWPGQPIVNDAWQFCPVSPYTFSWTPATWLSSTTVFNPALTPLATGNYTYTVLVTDIYSGCTSTSSVTVTVVSVPAAPTSSNVTRCGTGMVTLTATAAGPGTLQWWDAPTGGTMIGTGSPLTIGPISATTTFYVEEYDGNCPGPRIPVTVTVIPADTVTVSSTANPMCAGQPVTLTMSSLNTGYNYTWSPATGLSSTTGNSVTANPPFSIIYTINAIDAAGCESSTTINLTVNPSPVIVSISATPSTVCVGSPTQLDVNYILPPTNYIVSSIPYAPLPAPTTNAVLIPTGFWAAGDEGLTAPLNIGFNFNFFGNIYSTLCINSNGHLQFTPYPALNTYNPGAPLPDGFQPDDIIAMCWGDLDNSFAGTITYGTVGTSPNQKFIVQFTGVEVYGDAGSVITSQAILYEGTNCIEVHIGEFTTTSAFLQRVVGIENSTGTIGFTPPALNTGNWTITTPEAWQFCPQIPYIFSWTPSADLNNATISNPIATPTASTVYTVTITDPTFNCTSSANVDVSVYPLPVVTLAPINNLCLDSSPLTLTGGTPVGGNYSGTAVVNNIFYPAVSGIGTFTIYYTYSDNNGCSNTDSTLVNVYPLPVVTMPSFPVMCETSYPVNLNTGAPTGGTYSGPGVNANVFDPSSVGDGIYGITYTYTDVNGCSNTAFRNIVVLESPVANAGPDILGNNTLSGSATGGTPPYTYTWYPCLDLSNCNSQTPLATPAINTYYVLFVVDANGCFSTDTVYVISTVGIGTVPVENTELVVYPNPGSGMFNIIFIHPNSQAEVTVTDLIGQRIFSSGSILAPSTVYKVDIANQPDGIYILQVKYKDRIFTSRLVVNK